MEIIFFQLFVLQVLSYLSCVSISNLFKYYYLQIIASFKELKYKDVSD